MDNKVRCWTCARMINKNAGPWRSHMRKHVREGVLFMEDIRHKGGGVQFHRSKSAYWGFISGIDEGIVEITTHSIHMPRQSIQRFAVDGPVRIRDAVRLERRKVKGGSGDGMWFAIHLGYQATWENLP